MVYLFAYSLGLIRARLAGARIATGDVLIFLDAHCEANEGWCEPLLQRIKESRTSVLVPIIDVIDAKDFQYSTNGYKSFQVGGFQWSGHFDWVNLPEREKERQMRECSQPREICPAYSPTMAGGLFAMDRRYFWEVGSYDEQVSRRTTEAENHLWKYVFTFIDGWLGWRESGDVV